MNLDEVAARAYEAFGRFDTHTWILKGSGELNPATRLPEGSETWHIIRGQVFETSSASSGKGGNGRSETLTFVVHQFPRPPRAGDQVRLVDGRELTVDRVDIDLVIGKAVLK